MAKLNRVCFTCGKKHSYCPTCYDDSHLESWHIMFDNENCKAIFEIVNKSFYGHITEEASIIQLEKCNLNDLETFNEDIKNDIKNILSKKVVNIIKPTEEPVVNVENKISYKYKK